jgi:hypothetical protein
MAVPSMRHAATHRSGCVQRQLWSKNLVAGLAGNTELPADLVHGFPIQKPGRQNEGAPLSL